MKKGKQDFFERQQEHPDLSTVIDYVRFTFHCFDAQSGQVFY